MERIPLDIIMNHIIPYTYNIQPDVLLDDIRNYYAVKSRLIRDEYDTKIIRHELLANFYMDTQKLDAILDRQFHSKQYDHNNLNKYTQEVKFNILFGLLSVQERNYFSEYILTELRQWIANPMLN